jgi:uncharacterized protein (TIGR00369 family)
LSEIEDHLASLRQVNELARFNNWLNFDVVSASQGEVELRLPWREEFGQYAGYLHAGIIGALLDTACGFAAYTVVGRVLASQFSVKCLRPAVARTFIVKGRVIKPGKQQVFAAAELTGLDAPGKLLAIGDALLVPTDRLQK